jgi:hypothetical protein
LNPIEFIWKSIRWIISRAFIRDLDHLKQIILDAFKKQGCSLSFAKKLGLLNFLGVSLVSIFRFLIIIFRSPNYAHRPVLPRHPAAKGDVASGGTPGQVRYPLMGYGVEESTPPGGVSPLFVEHRAANHDEVPGETGPSVFKNGEVPPVGVPGCTGDTPKWGGWH